jgi:hypothetical protein
MTIRLLVMISLIGLLPRAGIYVEPRPANSITTSTVPGATTGSSKQPPRDFFSLRIGMNEEMVRRRLHKIARQEKEEREEEEGGEQEVWILKRDPRFRYLLVKFSRDHCLNWITVVANPKRVRYGDLANLDLATKATDGINYSYKWKVETSNQQPAFLIIARGSDVEFLTSYSVYLSR